MNNLALLVGGFYFGVWMYDIEVTVGDVRTELLITDRLRVLGCGGCSPPPA
eukprot:SAG11_NODE_3379_length_2488_cov_3.345333_2_plen_51_part_00